MGIGERYDYSTLMKLMKGVEWEEGWMSAEPSIIEIELCHQVGIFLLKIFYLKIFFSHGQGIFFDSPASQLHL